MPRFALHAIVFAAALTGCSGLNPLFPQAGEEEFRAGKLAIEQGRPEEGLALLERAYTLAPRSPEYRAQLVHQRSVFVNSLLAKADGARAGGYLDLGEGTYQRVLTFDAQNDKALAGLEAVKAARRHEGMLKEAEKLLAAGKLEEAQSRTRGILTEQSNHARARELHRQIEQQLVQARDGRRTLSPAFLKKVKVEFREQNLKSIFEVLSRLSGINFVFDKDVRPDLRTTIFLQDATMEEAVSVLLVTNQLARKILNDKTILIYPNTPAKVREYQELIVRTFFLTNADVKQTLNMIRTLVKTRDIFIDEKLGMLTMKDTPEAVRIAEKLIASQDLAEAEVVLEVEVLEIQRTRLQELGIVWPNQFTVLNIVPNPTTTTAAGGVVVQTTDQTTTTAQLTVETLRNLRSGSIGVSPNPQLNLRSDVGDSNLLANPRIRVRNREKARIHIGDKVPVITTTSTANVGISESVSYLDVGLKLDVEPTVFLDNEVAIRIGLEVSNIAREVTSRQGTLTYQVGTRTATTVLRVKDGETQVLAGLISDQDRTSASKVPGLGELPLVGRLFSNHRDDRSKTEIALLITPRVVRGLPMRELLTLEYPSGTEAAPGAPALELAPRSELSVPIREGGAPPATVKPKPEPKVSPPAPGVTPPSPPSVTPPVVPGVTPPAPGASPPAAGASPPVPPAPDPATQREQH